MGESGVREPTAVRSRLIIDLEAGTVAVGPQQAEGVHDRDTLLAEYLDLVYLLREVEPGSPVPIRQLDLEDLGRELSRREEAVERELHDLMRRPEVAATSHDSPLWSRRWWLPAAALLVLTLTGGSAAFAQTSSGQEPETSAPQPSVTGTVEIGTAVAYVRDPVTGEISQVEPGE